MSYDARVGICAICGVPVLPDHQRHVQFRPGGNAYHWGCMYSGPKKPDPVPVRIEDLPAPPLADWQWSLRNEDRRWH